VRDGICFVKNDCQLKGGSMGDLSYEVFEVPPFDLSDVFSVDAAFANAPEFEFRCAQQLGEGVIFCKGKILLGWVGDCLAVDAHLEDSGVWTAARHRNDPLFALGDMLELFAGVHGEKKYIEYHYAPNGLTLQLLWPENARKLGIRDVSELVKYHIVEDATEYAVHCTEDGWRVCVVASRGFGFGRCESQGKSVGYQFWEV
jgi:hypothetical protein